LEEQTRDRVPLDWATTQNNLANALLHLGQRENGTARLEEAITAYRAALEEYTSDRAPHEWAVVQNNLALTQAVLFDKTGDTAWLDSAIAMAHEALAIHEASGMNDFVTSFRKLLAYLQAKRAT
jgi:tetratricopeptide (TPR) repeat protein